MQHEPPTTDRDALNNGQGEVVSDPASSQGDQLHPPVSQPDGYLSEQLSTHQAQQPSGQTAEQQNSATGFANQPGNLPQENVAGQGYQPIDLIDQTSDMPDLGVLQLEGKKEGSLSDYTMQQLQLRSQPFIGASAEGELFADEVTFSQISEIKQAIIKGDTVLLLSGKEGAGKTTLLKQLTRNSGARLQFFSVKGGEKYTTHNLFSGILDAWKLTPKSDFEESAKEMLLALQANHERNTTVVLLLDDADLVPPKELHLLLATVQYFNSDEDLLRVILSASPEFETRLPQMLPQGLKLPYSALQVEPLLASRAAPYIQLRLNQAGHFDEFPLSEKQVSAIANDASGYPGRINFLTAETLNQLFSPFTDDETLTRTSDGFFSRLSRKKSGKTGKAVLAFVALGLIGAGIYKTVFQGQNDNAGTLVAGNSTGSQNSSNEFTTVETRPVADSNSSLNQSKPAIQADPANGVNNPVVPLEPVSSSTEKPADNTANPTDSQQTLAEKTDSSTDGNATALNTEAEPLDNAATELKAAAEELSAALGTTTTSGTIAANTTERTTEAAQTIENTANSADSKTDSQIPTDSTTDKPSPTQAAVQADAQTTAAASEVTDNTAATGDDSDAELPLAEPADVSKPADGTDSATDNSGEKPKQPAPQTAADATAAPSETNQASAEVADKPTANSPVSSLESPNWVLLQNPDQWTIQMSASTDKGDIDRFLKKAGLEGPTSIYSFKRNEVTWYALVQGLYSSLSEAREAIEGMNKAAVKNQPWIRKIGSIQASLKK